MKNTGMGRSERTVWVVDVLRAGRVLTPKVVAEHTGISRTGANEMLQRLATTMPIVKRDELWRWDASKESERE
jgi:hypothetical protein